MPANRSATTVDDLDLDLDGRVPMTTDESVPHMAEGLRVSHIETDRSGDEYAVTLGPDRNRCNMSCDYTTFERTDVDVCWNCDSCRIPVEHLINDD